MSGAQFIIVVACGCDMASGMVCGIAFSRCDVRAAVSTAVRDMNVVEYSGAVRKDYHQHRWMGKRDASVELISGGSVAA